MRKKSIYRGFLIVAGLLAAVVIIFSHSFSQLEPVVKKETKTEESKKGSEQQTSIQAPNEAVTQANAVKIDEQVPDMVLETIVKSEDTKKFIPEKTRLISKFFQVLFQIVIAPNAP